MILFFDTETNGLPKNYNGAVHDLDNWPRVIQLAWACFDDEGNRVSANCHLIQPFGWEIPKQPFWIDNGFTTERSLAEGVDIGKALLEFAVDMELASVIVAHNISFDKPIVQAEMLRLNISVRNRPAQYCTMLSSTDICRIPSMRGYKWPKLEELHRFLFHSEFEGAHDALNDVLATAKCFFKLRELGYIPAEALQPRQPKPSPLNIDSSKL